MEDKDLWSSLWQALYDNGSSARNEDATHRFWSTLNPLQQKAVHTNIIERLRAKKFVWFDPIRAIKESLRSWNAPQPQFLSGNEQDECRRQGIPMVQVKYGESFLICTKQTQEEFGLTKTMDW